MKLTYYMKDRSFIYFIYGITAMLVLIFMRAFHVPFQPIAIAGTLLFFGVVAAELLEFFRKKSYYDKLLNCMETLDQKYLISEMTTMPGFYEGKLTQEVLQEANKSMCERIAQYRHESIDFQEFIELWVHELKLPVSSLQLSLYNQKSEIPPKIWEQLRRIDNYIDTVLYYARSQNSAKDYTIQYIPLKKIIVNTAVKMREDLNLHAIHLNIHSIDFSVTTDGKWLEYILGQLMANSIQYAAEERDREIRIFAEDAGESILLHFWDNGIGISQSDLPYIFKKSFTGENGRIHAKSTGMGLYIVKNMCRKLGCPISVCSEHGTFTEFTIHFAKHDFYLF